MSGGPGSDIDYRILFEKSPAQFLVLDRQFNVLAATDSYCRAARVGRDVLTGRNILDLVPLDGPPSHREAAIALRESLERVVRLEKSDAMPIQRFDIQTSEGEIEERYWSTMNSPVFDEAGRFSWIIYRVRDVTNTTLDPKSEAARREREEELVSIIARLRGANEELARLDELRAGLTQMARLNTVAIMASALAHDMAQPVAAARNFLAALRRSDWFQSEKKVQAGELLGKIEAQIERASSIIRNLRQYMTAGEGQKQVDDLADLVHEAVKLSDPVLKVNNVEIEVAIEQNVEVVVDRVQIQQVLINLITNAADAMRDSASRRIFIRSQIADGTLRVDVADTGTGLAPDVAQRLFEPFTTTKSSGMGLGLPICRQIVKEHGGNMWASANVPMGTVFSFTLPRNSGEDSEAA